MSNTLTGKFNATLASARKYAEADGQDAVEFTWNVDGAAESVTSKLFLVDSAGQRNNAIINGTRKWCPEWDGTDLDWFITNFDVCRGAKTELQMDNGAVVWVFPAEQVVEASAEDGIAVRLVVTPANIAKAPCDVPPDFAHTKAFFDVFTEGTQREDANYFWTQLAAKVGPMQIDFTSDDWQKMISMIRLLKSTTVILPKRTK